MRTLASSINSSAMDTLYAFTQGIDVDRKFVTDEVLVEKAWARQLNKRGYITDDECRELEKALSLAAELILTDAFPWRLEDEDIHMNIEHFLVDRLGDTGKKLHLGSARKDLVATSLRLRVSRFTLTATSSVKSLITVLIRLAEANLDVIVPGMCHQQNGQPIRIAQVFSAYGFRLMSDLKRFKAVQAACLESMPLGSAAFAGTTLTIDREELAYELGFAKPCANCYDGVGDRDFLIDALHSMAMVAIHMAKICEDLIYWSSSNVALVIVPKNWSTGSSIMPNQRNPNVLEMVRARTALIIAAEQGGMNVLRGFGSSYSSDLHELKKTFFRVEEEFLACAEILALFMSEIKIDEDVANLMCFKGHILATDLANKLVARGDTFRDAYRKAADEVTKATAAGIQVCEGALFNAVSPGYGIEESVEERSAIGGTAKFRVEESLTHLRSQLATF